eukprot:CAMPEP_0172171292 /NCGR_PEP_ID=MMETSP1050-20130122/11810_1 /TAXON_ID=233186 /ORGANISM="Cryptomonas curvata, Strain CCAP979/52" /LENGTH=667 /DNA_ID=CAMNT_0012842705 /DNA_START=529 /DNA_END=2532 /DNA_ORIENTATION=+
MSFVQADLNRDASLSLQEWFVFRHFWAPVHLSSIGPLQAGNNGLVTDLSIGPLGGLYKDKNLIQTFVTNAVSILLAQYQYSSCCECQCCAANCTCDGPTTAMACSPWTYPPCPGNATGGALSNGTCQIDACNASVTPECADGRAFQRADGSMFTVLGFTDRCNADCRWDSSFVREATDGELSRLMAEQDLDGTGRISLEEHYFRIFADADADGALTPAEYAASLYPAGGFALHDLNGDGAVTFVERKFFAAAQSSPAAALAPARRVTSDVGLTREQWNFADLPPDFGTFDSHASSAEEGATEVRPLGFSYYAVLFRCALQAVRLYQVPASQYPWMPTCPIEVYTRQVGPWVGHDGPNGGKTGYLVDVWGEISSRLMWNTELVAANGSVAEHLQPPPIRGARFGTMSVGLFAQWGSAQAAHVTCSRSFAPSLDGLVVVVRSNPPSFSLIISILKTVPQYGFVNLVSFLIVVLFSVGHVIWFMERKDNSEQFDPLYFKGLIDSAWYLLVSMATIGYGDKVAATGPGKMVSFFWLFFGVLVFSVFLGNVMSAINIQIAEAAIDGPSKLGGFNVGIYSDETTRRLMLDSRFQFHPSYCTSIEDCIFDLLMNKNVSALLVPYADVLTYAVDQKLASRPCGSPIRTVGDPILVDLVPSAKLCIYSEVSFNFQS